MDPATRCLGLYIMHTYTCLTNERTALVSDYCTAAWFSKQFVPCGLPIDSGCNAVIDLWYTAQQARAAPPPGGRSICTFGPQTRSALTASFHDRRAQRAFVARRSIAAKHKRRRKREQAGAGRRESGKLIG